MDISQATRINQRALRFTGVLEVVDSIDYHKNRTIYRKTGLRDSFISIFPEAIFKEKDFHFYMCSNGKHLIMEVHNVHTLSKYIDDMSHMKYLGIHWDEIVDELKERHCIN